MIHVMIQLLCAQASLNEDRLLLRQRLQEALQLDRLSQPAISTTSAVDVTISILDAFLDVGAWLSST